MECIIRSGMPKPAVPWVGVILAGGRGLRMGGVDKALLPLGGRSLLERVIERARPQVSDLALNANGDPSRFAFSGLPVIADGIADWPGPLAGVLAALDWASEIKRNTGWVMTFPVDCPFVPLDLAPTLSAAITDQGGDIARAFSGDRPHPLAALWPIRLRRHLRRAMIEDGIRGVQEWTARYRVVQVEFPAIPFDPFLNINRPEDLETAGAWV